MSSGPGAVYLMAGGPGSRRKGGDPVVAQALAASHAAHPRVAYVGAPSGDNRLFFRMIAGMLKAAGADRVDPVFVASPRADMAKARESLRAADVVFVTGGDVEQGMEVMRRTGIDTVVAERHDAGAPVVGVSAGSITLAHKWVRWSDPDDDTTAQLFDCMGLAPVLCDTHGEGEDWQELMALLRLCAPGAVGYGIPTGRALRVVGSLRPEALGGAVHRFRRDKDGVERMEDLKPA